MDRRISPPQVLPGLGKRGARAPLPAILETLKVGMYTARNVPSAKKGRQRRREAAARLGGTQS